MNFSIENVFLQNSVVHNLHATFMNIWQSMSSKSFQFCIENVPNLLVLVLLGPPLTNMDIAPHSQDHLHSLDGISKKFARPSFGMISQNVWLFYLQTFFTSPVFRDAKSNLNSTDAKLTPKN